MRKWLWLLVAVPLVSGCSMQTGVKSMQSSLVGLDRVITLYSSDGKVLKEWRGRYKVEDFGGSISFIHNFKTIKIAGTYTVEEV